MTDDTEDLLGHRMPYAGEPPSQRHSDTSRAAAAAIKKRIGPLHLEILDFLATGGATDEEMQISIPMAANTQRPRRCELTAMGRIEDSGLRRLTKSRREAVIWRLVRR
jgi:hypothetical protein